MGGFRSVLDAGIDVWAAVGGEQSSQGVPGSDGTLAAHRPGGGAGVLGLLVFLDIEGTGEVGLPSYLVCSWPAGASPTRLRQQWTYCATPCDVLTLPGPGL